MFKTFTAVVLVVVFLLDGTLCLARSRTIPVDSELNNWDLGSLTFESKDGLSFSYDSSKSSFSAETKAKLLDFLNNQCGSFVGGATVTFREDCTSRATRILRKALISTHRDEKDLNADSLLKTSLKRLLKAEADRAFLDEQYLLAQNTYDEISDSLKAGRDLTKFRMPKGLTAQLYLIKARQLLDEALRQQAEQAQAQTLVASKAH